MLATGASLSDKWVSTLGGGSDAISRATTFRMCSALRLPLSSTSSTATSTASSPATGTAADLRHDPVTAGMTPQAVLKLTQRHRQISKGRAVAQRAACAHQRDVVLPVVADLVAIQQARMAGNQRIIGHHLDAVGYKRLLTHLPAYSHGTE